MSYFKKCEKCGNEINSYDSTLCQNCLEKELKCVDCGNKIDINQYYHRARLCFPCEDKREKKSIDEQEQFDNILKEKDGVELEEMWQSQCFAIKTALEKYYECGDEKFRVMAEQAQQKQSKIQDYITENGTRVRKI